MIATLQNCVDHGQTCTYVCLEDGCAPHAYNCGDCLYDFHLDHISKVQRIATLVNLLTQDYQNSLNQHSPDVEEQLQKSKISNNLNDQIQNLRITFSQSYDNFQQEINQLIDNNLIENDAQVEDLDSYAQLLSYFQRPTFELNEEFRQKVLDIQTQLQKIKEVQEQRDQILIKFDSNKLKVDKSFKDFDGHVSSQLKILQKVQNLIIRSLGTQGGGLQVFDFTFNTDTLHKMTINSDGTIITCGSGCSQDKYVLSNEQLPQIGQSYFEIQKSHVSGCYDSIGVCTKYVQRNGTTQNGWAVRLYGDHSDFQFSGSIHNGQSKRFYKSWCTNDRIGVLYDADQKTLTYFVNGKKIGTPFNDVDGELYICVEGCHLGSFQKINNPELPEQEQLEAEEPVYN